MVDPDSPALYPNAVLEIRPILSPDFNTLSVELFTYFSEPDGNGGSVLRHAATRFITLASADMETDEPQIAQILAKLEKAVWKSLERELEPYNQGVDFDEIGGKK